MKYYTPIIIIIPHAMSYGGYNVFDPSVRQSVSPVFLVNAAPPKPLNRISWNIVLIKDLMCRCANAQNILMQFFSRSYALFELRNLVKWKILLKPFVSATSPKPLNRISWHFVVMKDLMCGCAYPQEILIQLYFWE